MRSEEGAEHGDTMVPDCTTPHSPSGYPCHARSGVRRQWWLQCSCQARDKSVRLRWFSSCSGIWGWPFCRSAVRMLLECCAFLQNSVLEAKQGAAACRISRSGGRAAARVARNGPMSSSAAAGGASHSAITDGAAVDSLNAYLSQPPRPA